MVNFDHQQTPTRENGMVSFAAVRDSQRPYAYCEAALVAIPDSSLAMRRGECGGWRATVASLQRSSALQTDHSPRQDDGAGFDAWTRRKFGLMAGGLTAALLGLAGSQNSEAKKKGKKRKRRARQEQDAPVPPTKTCGSLGGACTPGQTLCCSSLLCIQVPLKKEETEFTCCKGKGQTCGGATDECCLGLGLGCISGVCQPLPPG
jgi:hypothetical protein